MTEPFVIEGYLNLVSQEGGYVAPEWAVDNRSIADDVATHFGIKFVGWEGWEPNKYPYIPGDQPIGRVRLTIELLESE